MRLYVIRHGQTDWNVAHRIQGSQDIPLNATGLSQAARLGEAMSSRPVAAVFSSPQQRALATAHAVADRQGVSVTVLPELVEISYGEWEGRTSEDILTTDKELYEAWWKQPAQVAPPGGETLLQVDTRCRAAWEKIRARIRGGELKGDAAVVAHGGVLAHFMTALLADGPDAGDIVVANASITTLEYDPVDDCCWLVTLNDCSHLQ